MAAPLISADVLSFTPATKKGGVFSSGNSSRRQSLSNVSATPSIPQGIGYSPGSISSYQTDAPSPAGSGIPSFRTLRSLLPFGSSKNSSPSNSASPNTSRSPFANFGSVRRSMNKDRERKSSLSNEATHVISIGPSQSDNVRRSVSLSRLEKPLPSEPDFSRELSDSFHSERLSASDSRIPRRIPSPSPVGELSIIVEADNSGVSKHLPLIGIEGDSAEPEASMKPHAHSTLTREATKSIWRNPSTLDLATDSLAEEVRQALRSSTSSSQSTSKWMEGAFEPVVIDGDEHPDLADASFDGVNLTSLIPLSSNAHRSNDSHSPPYSPRNEENSPTPSPSTATFPSPASTSRLPRSRHGTSFLPRLRPSESPSLPSSSTHFLPTPSPTRTSASVDAPRVASIPTRGPAIALNGNGFSITSPPRSPSSPGLSLASTSTPARRKATHSRSMTLVPPPSASASGSRTSGLSRRDTKSTSNTFNSSSLVSRTLRQAILGNNSRINDRSGLESFVDSSSLTMMSTPTRNSLDSRRAHHTALSRSNIGLGRPSLEIRRGNSFDSRIRSDEKGGSTPNLHQQIFHRTASDVNSMSEAAHSHEQEKHYRPSSDMTRPSYEPSSRPGSVARMRERDQVLQRTSSLRVTDTAGEHAPPHRETIHAARQRKRSMSVQERPPKGRPPSEISPAAITRPGSSASVYGARGGRRGERELENGSGSGYDRSAAGGGGAAGPRMEWLGPRTAKAFRAAGLLDFEREEEQESKSSELSATAIRYGSGSLGGASPSPTATALSGSGLLARNRLLSGRSASEYNPVASISHSRMAFSEMGVSSHGRRGSGSFSVYGGSASAHGGGSQYGHTGLTDSPTFTVSSSSRERDTPKSSISTAPTSLSESAGYTRDRMERERDRDEMRELKERHATEMGALLNALSDTQRTVRILREENSQVRDRIDKLALVGRENEDLRHACEVLEREVIRLSSDNRDLQHELAASRSLRTHGGLTQSWSQSSVSTASFKTPITKQGKRSPLAIDTTPQFLQGDDDPDEDDEAYNNTMIIHDDEDVHEHGPDYGDSRTDHPLYSDMTHKSSATPSMKRRSSSSSSIFPVLPANMTMLLHDDGVGGNEEFNRNIVDISLPSTGFLENGIGSLPSSQSRSVSGTPPISYGNFSKSGHRADKSITSTISISPTTANFSMTTGSPRSLVLRPEHEILLGDMESLDLGVHDTDADSTTSAIDRVATRNGW